MIIMDDKLSAPIGHQIRQLRRARGWTLAELASRAGTSAPSLHRYEGGWDRYRLSTLRRIGAALGARIDVQLTALDAQSRNIGDLPLDPDGLASLLEPLFWDADLTVERLGEFPEWVLARALSFGTWDQVRAARRYYGDDMVMRAANGRSVDERTRSFWALVLEGGESASQGPA